MSEEATEAAEVTTEETAPETTQGTTTTAEETAPAWHYADGVAGAGDAPEWFKGDKYANVEDQAKAYKDLESRFGSFTGSPEEYAVEISKELQERGIEIAADDPMIEEAIKFATESNMDQDGFNKMVELYAMTEVAKSEALESSKADEIKSLGDNAQSRLDGLDQWAKSNLPEDLYEGFQEMAISARAVQTMEKLVAMTRNAPISPAETRPQPSMGEEELRKMQFEKDDHGNRRIQTDPAFKARFNKMASEIWGSEDHRIVVGR